MASSQVRVIPAMTAPAMGEPAPMGFRFWRHAFVPGIWPLGVTLACVAAGFRVRNPGLPSAEQWLEMACYVLLLIPVHASRQALYEGGPQRPLPPTSTQADQHRSQVFQVLFLPLGFAALLIGVLLLCYQQALRAVVDATLAHALTGVDIPGTSGGTISARVAASVASMTWHSLSTVAVGLIPVYGLHTLVISLWPGSDSLCFRWRSVFPWLLTVAISFMLGWSAGNPLPSLVVTDFFLVVLFLSVMGPRRRAQEDEDRPFRQRPPRVRDSGFALAAIGGLLALIFATVSVSVFRPETSWAIVLQASLLSILLACGVLVTDAWRLAAMSQDPQYQSYFDSAQLAKAKYLPGANLATAAGLPLLLLTSLHPATGVLYFAGICVLSLVLAIWWCYLGADKATSYSPWVRYSAFASISLLLLVAGGTVRLQTGTSPTLGALPPDWPVGLGSYSGCFGLGVGALLWLLRGVLKPLVNGQVGKAAFPLRTGMECALLMATSSLVLMCATSFGLLVSYLVIQVLHWHSNSIGIAVIAGRFVQLMLAYFVGAVFLFASVAVHSVWIAHRTRANIATPGE